MNVSRIKKTGSFQAAGAMREAALVQKLELTKAELRRAQAEAAEAKAELATVREKLDATTRPRKPISRLPK